MRMLLWVFATAGLSACATYQAPADGAGAPAAVVHPPPFIYAGGLYPWGFRSFPYALPYAMPYALGTFPRRLPQSGPGVKGPQPVPGNTLAGAVRRPHANN